MQGKYLYVLTLLAVLSSLLVHQAAWAQNETLSTMIERCAEQCQPQLGPDFEACVEAELAIRQERLEECRTLPEGSAERQECFTEVFRDGPDCHEGETDQRRCVAECLGFRL